MCSHVCLKGAYHGHDDDDNEWYNGYFIKHPEKSLGVLIGIIFKGSNDSPTVDMKAYKDGNHCQFNL